MTHDLFTWRPVKAQTLEQARDQFVERLDEGSECPVAVDTLNDISVS